MLLQCLHVHNFRLYDTVTLRCEAGLNLLFGPNGSGKTTLLEAICLCAWGRVLDAPDPTLLKHGTEFFRVRAEALTDAEVPYWVEVEYHAEHGKQIRSQQGSRLTPGELVGSMPIVLLTPAMKEITAGAPQQRRRFIDMVLSQSSRHYVQLLLEHRRILRQRNALLQHPSASSDFPAQWNSWTELFIQRSAELIWRRWKFIQDFEPLVQSYHERIAPERLRLLYLPDGVVAESLEQGVTAIRACLQQRAAELRSEELRRAQTLFGPQRDDLLILLNGMSARDAASQGQHKSILLSLKLAELDYLRHQRGETPMMLLDDVFAELDRQRIHEVLRVLEDLHVQSFVTITETERLPNAAVHRAYRVRIEAGRLIPDEQSSKS
ncbi:MAG: DNA replication and repair protein RecF [Candidatus Kapabacteria bacterium]|nr:DNA replication and repair protein RecF [Candidatus Kapabacteria bacterium]MDW8011560.1 DNA replication and repair protein RecF [Bacteroidota bacterium]